MAEKLTFDADPNPTLRAYDQLEQADKDFLQQALDSMRKQSEAHKKQLALLMKEKQEHRNLGREAKKVWEQTRTPLERYNSRMVHLGTLLKARKIDTDTYRRATEQATKEMRSHGSESNRAFTAAASNVKSYVTGVLTISTAFRAGTAAFREFEKTRREAAQRQLEQEEPLSRLAQLAKTPDEFADLTGRAKQLFAEGGARTLGDAAQTIFSLASAGALEATPLFRDLAGVVADPGVLAKAATTIKTSLGVQETGSLLDIVSKGFAASEFSPAEVESLLEAAARSGGSARTLGLRDEDILAATAQLATATGGAELGGTQLASLLKAFVGLPGKKKALGGKEVSLAGLSLREQLQAVEALGLDDVQLQKALGREEAVQAFRTLTIPENVQQFGQIVQSIEKAQDDQVATQKRQIALSAPEIAGARARRIAQAGRELGERALGTTENIAQAVTQESLRQRRQVLTERGERPLDREFKLIMDRLILGFQRLLDEEKFINDRLKVLPDQNSDMVKELNKLNQTIRDRQIRSVPRTQLNQ